MALRVRQVEAVIYVYVHTDTQVIYIYIYLKYELNFIIFYYIFQGLFVKIVNISDKI
jgi:hypothetical protein